MRPLNFGFSKTDNFIFFRKFVGSLQTYVHQCSEFKFGTAMGLGDIDHSITASKQIHTGMKSLRQNNNKG